MSVQDYSRTVIAKCYLRHVYRRVIYMLEVLSGKCKEKLKRNSLFMETSFMVDINCRLVAAAILVIITQSAGII